MACLSLRISNLNCYYILISLLQQLGTSFILSCWSSSWAVCTAPFTGDSWLDLVVKSTLSLPLSRRHVWLMKSSISVSVGSTWVVRRTLAEAVIQTECESYVRGQQAHNNNMRCELIAKGGWVRSDTSQMEWFSTHKDTDTGPSPISIKSSSSLTVFSFWVRILSWNY